MTGHEQQRASSNYQSLRVVPVLQQAIKDGIKLTAIINTHQ